MKLVLSGSLCTYSLYLLAVNVCGVIAEDLFERPLPYGSQSDDQRSRAVIHAIAEVLWRCCTLTESEDKAKR